MADSNGRHRDLLLTVESLAVILTAVLLLWQTSIIAKHTGIFTELAGTAAKSYQVYVDVYKGSVVAEKTDRSERWASKIREKETWTKLISVNSYLRDTKDEQIKIHRIETEKKFRNDFYALLALFEDLGYLYNTGKVDRDFMKRSPSAVIVSFYDNSEFWINYRRRIANDPRIGSEFETMAQDLKKGAGPPSGPEGK